MNISAQVTQGFLCNFTAMLFFYTIKKHIKQNPDL